MNKETDINAVIERVEKMEGYYDEIQHSLHCSADLLDTDSEISIMLEKLIDYYENGQWLSDYECDERGELPACMKRGVLSEDGVYNLISDIMAFRNVPDDV